MMTANAKNIVKSCQNCTSDFTIKLWDQKFYKKMKVPAPTLCPNCRHQRRLAFRAEKYLYHDKCDLCKKPMISTFSEDKVNTVYCNKCWWSDKWDPLEYGLEYDENKSFFEQIKTLLDTVPFYNIFNTGSENCDYCNYAPFNRNCYLLFGGWKNEDCMYCDTSISCTQTLDSYSCENIEQGYECIDTNNSFNSAFLQNCDNCRDSMFLFDCQNCKNCIGCVNLRHKEYYYLNKPIEKEEFEKIKKAFTSRKHLTEFREKFTKYIKEHAIHKYLIGIKNVAVSGNLIFESQNVVDSFAIWRCENMKYIWKGIDQHTSMDCNGSGEGELAYETLSSDFGYNSKFIVNGQHLQNCMYNIFCHTNKNLLGCVGLRNKKFCILNKQYSKEEYIELGKKIIADMKKPHLRQGFDGQGGEYGEFFPISISPWAYNETMAHEHFPLTKEEATKKGYSWIDMPSKRPESCYSVADNIHDVTDEITQNIACCDTCSNGFKITTQELSFYRNINLPVPDKCFYCRHKERFNLRNPNKLWKRTCTKCEKKIQTSYDPGRPERVYCEECYLKEVY